LQTLYEHATGHVTNIEQVNDEGSSVIQVAKVQRNYCSLNRTLHGIFAPFFASTGLSIFSTTTWDAFVLFGGAKPIKFSFLSLTLSEDLVKPRSRIKKKYRGL
jgi:hypothetical protein